MRILVAAEYVNPHTMPVAYRLADELGEQNIRYASSISLLRTSRDPLLEDRAKQGWKLKDDSPWVIYPAENTDHREEFERWWQEADVVLSGVRDFDRSAKRLRGKKPVFYYSERWWKPPIGLVRLLHPRFALMMARFYRLSFSPAFHYLPLGDYAASDMDRVGMFRGHMWRWGNFINPSDPLPPCLERKGEFRLLWAGRMLPWKRVDTLIRAFAALHHRRPPARLTLIGTGVSREPWQNLVRQLGVESQVEFQDSIPIAQVRQAMRDSHAYVLPSSGYEGWGVVINEAMSEGCTVVASRAAGAPKTLIRHGENGLLFSPGNHEELSRLLIQLSEDEPLRRKLGEAGQRTIVDGWTPAIAARRFLDFCHTMLSNRPLPDFTDGPMAPAWKR